MHAPEGSLEAGTSRDPQLQREVAIKVLAAAFWPNSHCASPARPAGGILRAGDRFAPSSW
jgi:hypothetical protein